MGGAEKKVFALRGMAALLIEERLYKEVEDPEFGVPYASFDRFLKQEFPNSWSYIGDALRAVKELRQVPFEDLLQIKRANLEQLKAYRVACASCRKWCRRQRRYPKRSSSRSSTPNTTSTWK